MDLDIPLSTLSLPDIALEPKIITCTVEGILEESDLRVLVGGASAPTSGSAPDKPAGPAPEFIPLEEAGDMKRLRERHHSVARMISKGMQQRIVARITGYTEAYLSTLLNAPAMQELVEFYRVQNGAAAEVIGERLRTVGLKAIDKIEDKLETEDMTAFELAAVAKLGLDRAGHGPSSKTHIVSEEHLIDHAEIKRLNQQALSRSAENIIPMSQVRQALPSPADNKAADATSEGVADARH